MKVNYEKVQTVDGVKYPVLAKILGYTNQKSFGGMTMEKDTLFSGESVNVEYKVAVPKDSAKYMKTVVAYANGRGAKSFLA